MDEKDNAVMDKVPAWKDDSVYYLIANLAAYFCMCVVCVFVVINLIESIIVRICVLPVLFLLCAYLEERVVVKFVGILLKYTLIKFLEEKIWKTRDP